MTCCSVCLLLCGGAGSEGKEADKDEEGEVGGEARAMGVRGVHVIPRGVPADKQHRGWILGTPMRAG